MKEVGAYRPAKGMLMGDLGYPAVGARGARRHGFVRSGGNGLFAVAHARNIGARNEVRVAGLRSGVVIGEGADDVVVSSPVKQTFQK